MEKSFSSSNKQPHIQKSLFLSISVFTFAWLTTFFTIRLFWGNFLKPLNPLILIVDYFIPLCMIVGFILLVGTNDNNMKIILIFFLVIFILALTNILIFNIHIMNYGDKGTLSGMISHRELFPRWLLGTGLLEFIRYYVISPIWPNPREINFVRIMSALIMCISSVLLTIKQSKNLCILLTVFAPF